MYQRMNLYESTCLRCGGTVYQVDRVGPLKDFTFFHGGCFKCAVCGTRLTLKTYCNNRRQHEEDREVYCASHVPGIGPGHLDGSAVGIRAALNVPRSAQYVNEQIRGCGGARAPALDADALHIRAHLNGSAGGHNRSSSPSGLNNQYYHGNGSGGLNTSNNSNGGHHTGYHNNSSGFGEYQYGRFDASALHIAHALKATKIQRAYGRPREKPIDCYLDRDEQTKLEMKHRREEDDLYRKFAKQREEEDMRMTEEFREEWEKELERLSSRFEREMSAIGGSRKKKKGTGDEEISLRLQQEREDLEKNMTLRRDRKKESITRKLLEHERAATAALVEKQSREMLDLINEKRSEYMRAESLYLDDELDDEDDDFGHGGLRTSRGGGGRGVKGGGGRIGLPEEGVMSAEETAILLEPYPSQPPAPMPPPIPKAHLYQHPIEFAQVDQIAISVAQEDQKTFTDLVRQLVGRCGSDVEKARTIFRWITVKNLNTMQFDDNLRGDTPMGLLRGIKHGTESYHVLFKRLCSYAGLHCVVIKGYSKSAGYQPGVRFEDNRFRNSWNAVFVAGAWRFVQCNWGARHLVNAKEVPKPGVTNSPTPAMTSSPVTGNSPTGKGKSDSLRYEYDDHYFLTDPREFIYEFYPLQPEWQLLKQPITLSEFEDLPFVRSLFFRYGLYFPDTNTKAVMNTDSTGAATIRIGMPPHMQSSLIFHYNLKSCDSESDTYDGVSLKRFVMQSVVGDVVAFRVHAPCSGSFLLDVFANAVTPREYLTGEPMKFKSVCKFRITCISLATVMVPLPDCAGGEWGPAKAKRLFGLEPLSHPDALAFAGRSLHVRFRMRRPLAAFVAALHKNGADERKLSRYVSHTVEPFSGENGGDNGETDFIGDVVTFHVTFPEEGQYGLDIYTREAMPEGMDSSDMGDSGGLGAAATAEKHLLTHCCKYLINSSKKN
ncbi:hillarin [Ischnura elegans]|uniref:hillarin n=1 Tax=Ischnura elegans TaxID=197161 RepID=UPI001ED8B6E5|nr:hillarin [Ischnura elegans]XP_046388959.1 hillarin [Ischnura elegans]